MGVTFRFRISPLASSVLRPTVELASALPSARRYSTSAIGCRAKRSTATLRFPRMQRRELRLAWSKLLESGAPKRSLYLQAECVMLLPAVVGDYTDFYASIHHATNVGRMFRPDNPLLPNYKHVPIAYHGRSSSLVVGGTPVRRPYGQLGEGRFGPSRELDYEVELGAFLGPGNRTGPADSNQRGRESRRGCVPRQRLVGPRYPALGIPAARAVPREEFRHHPSRRGYVTLEALAPFRSIASVHDVPVLPYLQEGGDGAFDITVEAWLRTPAMQEAVRLSRARSATCTGPSVKWSLTTPRTAVRSVLAI